MASAPLIPPFWSRIPRFFVFPLQPASLLRVLGLAAVPALGVFANSIPAMLVLSGGLALLAWVFLLRFACRVLNETSLGRLSPSDYSPLADESMAYMPYKLMLLFTIPGFVVGVLTAVTGETFGMLANLLVTLAMPAAVMAMVVSRSLVTGLNPAASWSIISSIGKPYLLLCVFLFCLSSGQLFLIVKLGTAKLMPLAEHWSALQAAAQQAYQAQDEEAFDSAMEGLRNFLPSIKPTLASTLWMFNAVAMYFTLIAMNMLGYVLYQFHEALGLEVEVLPGRRKATTTPADTESEQIAALIADGKLDAALEIAYEAQRLNPDASVQNRYNKLLHLAGKDERLLNHSQRLIPLLLDGGHERNAVDCWKRCRERQPEFRPEDGKNVVRLAEAARAQREPRAAMEILNGFDKAFRNHPLLPEVYFLGGRILCEDLRRDDMADRFFATLCTRYPEHHRVEEALRMRDTIRRVKKAALAKQATPG